MSNNKLKPNFTQTPNYILDELWPILTPPEKAIIMVICRQTYGWHKDTDKISISQMMEKTGLAKASITKNTNSMVKKGYIAKAKFSPNSIPVYQLNIPNDEPVQSVNTSCSIGEQQTEKAVQSVNTQKKELKKLSKESDISKGQLIKEQNAKEILERFNIISDVEEKQVLTKKVINGLDIVIKKYGKDKILKCVEGMKLDKFTIDNPTSFLLSRIYDPEKDYNIPRFLNNLKGTHKAKVPRTADQIEQDNQIEISLDNW